MLNALMRFKQILLLPLAVIVVFVVPALAASVLAADDVGGSEITVDFVTAPSEPVAINQQISFTASFTDPGATLTHVAEFDWGDGSTLSPGTVDENDRTVVGDHIYNDPGIYTVLLTVYAGDPNDPEASGEASSSVVVFDPEGGSVTGGGWIDSQAGKANFGFVSKYKKGANVPIGNTEFNVVAGGLNFHSDTYEWLKVNQNDHNAQFKGSGTINGDLAPNGELFKFMIWAEDLDPGGDDTFRIKIWYEDDGSEVIVYDNGGEAIGGGNIIIHKAK